MTGYVAAAALALLLAAGCAQRPASTRARPVCAVRDCKTGEILDDGCAADGKCSACVNDCGGRVAPRNGPVSSTFSLH